MKLSEDIEDGLTWLNCGISAQVLEIHRAGEGEEAGPMREVFSGW